ncbi:stage II sporulation protein D [Terribacillus saccharophilus]|uniref:stage II sporulation protein D n=1 Tax=Terribacillus saccharophilus TaxID=361277 RepID=UPI000BA57838|nr:stage II sporulation protein D [Terribacillus saccharophilus]PAF40455.1 stage II sporulation protein D [Terribacillus saccharophilus]
MQNKKPSTKRRRLKSHVIISILIICLFTVIMALPTLIVVPFIDPGGMERTATAMEQEKEIKETASVAVEVSRTASNSVETVPLETYVTRVVASEMPADFELEALKAQAVAARTYVVRYMEDHQAEKPEAIEVSDSTSDQVYKNEEELRQAWGKDYEEKMTKLTEAVEGTSGEIIMYDGEPITPSFFSTSNGYTENAEDYWENPLPYLKSVESPWDKQSPKFEDQKVIEIEEAEKLLGVDIDPNKPPGELKRNSSQRVSEIEIGGKKFTGREIREKLGLKSTDFTLSMKDNHLIFQTKGYGHGVGMSQYGANGMAAEGKTYKDILTYYYKDTEINKLPAEGAKLVSK